MGDGIFFFIWFASIAVALIVGNTSGQWGLGFWIGVGGAVVGLVISWIYGKYESEKYNNAAGDFGVHSGAAIEKNDTSKSSISKKPVGSTGKDTASRTKNNVVSRGEPKGGGKAASTKSNLKPTKKIKSQKELYIEEISTILNECQKNKYIDTLVCASLKSDAKLKIEGGAPYRRVEALIFDKMLDSIEDDDTRNTAAVYLKFRTKATEAEAAANGRSLGEQSSVLDEANDENGRMTHRDASRGSIPDNDETITGTSAGYKFVNVYHLTDSKNIPSIMRLGIKSRRYCEKFALSFEDIADENVESNHRSLFINGRPVDSYARCFFNPLPPMYHNRAKENSGLCVVELKIPFTTDASGVVKLSIAGEDGRDAVILREGITWNRRSLQEIVTDNFDSIKWHFGVIHEEDNKKDILAKRSAELLVYPDIPPEYISNIYSNSKDNSFAHDSMKELEAISRLGRVSIIKEELV